MMFFNYIYFLLREKNLFFLALYEKVIDPIAKSSMNRDCAGCVAF